jgi:hypothetical protein
MKSAAEIMNNYRTNKKAEKHSAFLMSIAKAN